MLNYLCTRNCLRNVNNCDTITYIPSHQPVVLVFCMRALWNVANFQTNAENYKIM